MKIRSLPKMAVRRTVRRIFGTADNSSGLSADNCPQENPLRTMASGSADNPRFSVSANSPVLRTQVPLSRRGHNCPQGFRAHKSPLQNPVSWPRLRRLSPQRAMLARVAVNNIIRDAASCFARAAGPGARRLASVPGSLIHKLSIIRAPSNLRCADRSWPPILAEGSARARSNHSRSASPELRWPDPARYAAAARDPRWSRTRSRAAAPIPFPSHVEPATPRRCASVWHPNLGD